MAIIRWRPMRDMVMMGDEIARRVAREMRDTFSDFDEYGASWKPMLDVSESTDAYNVKIDLAGVKPEEVSIEVNDDVLTISGERKEEKVSDDQGTHVQEISYGKFTRSVRLPLPIDPDNVKAKYDAGLLKITLPKSEKSKPKKIEIEK